MDFSIKKQYYISPLIKFKLNQKNNNIEFIFCCSKEKIVINHANSDNKLINFLLNFDNSINLIKNLQKNWIKPTKNILVDIYILFKKNIFLRDLKEIYKHGLSYEELNYYINNIVFFNKKFWLDGFKLQSKIKTKKIAIIWLWWTWTALLSHFIWLWFSEIRLIDYDTVDVSNIQRQYFYSLEDVWKKKTSVMKKIIKKRNKYTKIKTLDIKIDGNNNNINNIVNFIEWVDLLIDAADEWAEKLWLDIQKISFKLNIPFCSWSWSGWYIYPLVIPNVTACYECLFREFWIFEKIKYLTYSKPLLFNYNSVSFHLLWERNSYVAKEIINFLLFNKCELINSFFTWSDVYSKKSIEKNKNCSFCNSLK